MTLRKSVGSWELTFNDLSSWSHALTAFSTPFITKLSIQVRVDDDGDWQTLIDLLIEISSQVRPGWYEHWRE